MQVPAKWKIYDVFHVSLLNFDNTKTRQVYKVANNLAKIEEKLEGRDNKEYEFKEIINNAVYS